MYTQDGAHGRPVRSMKDTSTLACACLCTLFGILVGLLCLPFTAAAAVQTGDNAWSIPVRLFAGEGYVREPVLAADQTGVLHACWADEQEGGSMALLYARWDGSEWTQPVDVIAMPGTLQGPSIAVDQFGIIHLIWRGFGNALYYSSASAAGATSAAAWSAPRVLAVSNPHAHIVVDQAGGLHIVYPALDGVYYIYSADSGSSWTAPLLLAMPSGANATTDFARLAVAPNGDLHVVWTELELPNGWPPLGVFYSRSFDGGETWSTSFQMAGEGYLEVNVVPVDQNLIHTAWNAMVGISGRYHRWSSDSGMTWSETDEIVPAALGGGSTNPPGLAVDASGVVHVVVNTNDTIPRTGPGEFGATLYSSWGGSGWLPPVNISSPAPGYSSVNNEASAIAVLNGNQLHVLFIGDAATSLWHTSLLASAPGKAAEAFQPVPPESPAVDLQRQETPAPELTAAMESAFPAVSGQEHTSGTDSPRQSRDPISPILIGLLPALILVSGILVFRLVRRQTSR